MKKQKFKVGKLSHMIHLLKNRDYKPILIKHKNENYEKEIKLQKTKIKRL